MLRESGQLILLRVMVQGVLYLLAVGDTYLKLRKSLDERHDLEDILVAAQHCMFATSLIACTCYRASYWSSNRHRHHQYDKYPMHQYPLQLKPDENDSSAHNNASPTLLRKSRLRGRTTLQIDASTPTRASSRSCTQLSSRIHLMKVFAFKGLMHCVTKQCCCE